MIDSIDEYLSPREVPTSFGKLYVRLPPRRQSSEVIIFLHGFGSSWTVWQPVIDCARNLGLFKDRDAMAVDLPGFGRSENVLGHLDANVVASEVIKLARGLGYARIRVAGHSMGGFLALDMAARLPEEICSVHIVSGAYFTLLDMVNRPVITSLRAPLVGIFYWTQVLLSRQTVLAERVNQWIAYWAQKSPRTKPTYAVGGPGFRYGASNGAGYNARIRWGSIRIPVHGAFGARDRIVAPRDLRQLQAVLPAAKLTLVPGTGHSSLVQEPYQVARALFGSLLPAPTLGT